MPINNTVSSNNDILNNNSNQIYRYNSFLASKILNHRKLQGEAAFVNSKSGSTNLLYNNIPVHSEEDPVKESLEILNSLGRNNEADTVVIYGLGLGYLLKRFAEDYKGNIVIYEPNLDILRITFESVDFSKEFASPKISITHLPEDIVRYIMNFYNPSGKVHFAALNSYKTLFPDIYEQIFDEVEYCMPEEYTGGELKVNIGAGKWKKQGWKTIDCYRFASIFADLRTTDPFPLDDSVITKAFCSHCIEHIENQHLENFFRELYRCMKPGAIFRVSCPDADLAFEAYKRGDTQWFEWMVKNNLGAMLVNTFVSYKSGGPAIDDETVKEKFETLGKEDFIEWCVSLKDLSRGYIAHTNGFTYEKLERKLAEAGFAGIRKSGYRQSWDPEFRSHEFDLHPQISLYVECYKS